VKSSALKVKTVETLPCSAHVPITASYVRPPATPFFGALRNRLSYDLAFNAITVAGFKKLFSCRQGVELTHRLVAVDGEIAEAFDDFDLGKNR
jgi:hypothetical protein